MKFPYTFWLFCFSLLLGWQVCSHAKNKNLEAPEGKAPAPFIPVPQNTFVDNRDKDPLDLTGIDLKDPSALLEVDEQVQGLPNQPTDYPPNFSVSGGGSSTPLLPPLTNASAPLLPPMTATNSGPDPDADLSSPDPNAPAPVAPAPVANIEKPKLSNVKPMTASAGEIPTQATDLELSAPATPPTPPESTVTNPQVEKRSRKSGPLVMAPSYFHPELKQCPPPAGTFTDKVMPPPTVPAPPLKGISDISIILSNNEFFPSKVLLKEGNQIRLIFTTVNKKPAALVIEKLQIQRWVAKEDEPNSKTELERSKFELTRELSSSRVTEVIIDPKPGTYSFHDVITGASGEISVE